MVNDIPYPPPANSTDTVEGVIYLLQHCQFIFQKDCCFLLKAKQFECPNMNKGMMFLVCKFSTATCGKLVLPRLLFRKRLTRCLHCHSIDLAVELLRRLILCFHRFSPHLLGENNFPNGAKKQRTTITSVCRLRSINTFVLHTQFNMDFWHFFIQCSSH